MQRLDPTTCFRFSGQVLHRPRRRPLPLHPGLPAQQEDRSAGKLSRDQKAHDRGGVLPAAEVSTDSLRNENVFDASTRWSSLCVLKFAWVRINKPIISYTYMKSKNVRIYCCNYENFFSLA